MQTVFRVYRGNSRFCPIVKRTNKVIIPDGLREHYGIKFIWDTGWDIGFELVRPTTELGISTIIYALESIFNGRRSLRNRRIILFQMNKGDVV